MTSPASHSRRAASGAAIVYLTAIFELLALLYAYHAMAGVSKVRLTRVLRNSAIATFLLLIAYLAMISMFTSQIPNSDIRFVTGFQCLEIPAGQYPNCPLLTTDQMAEASSDPQLLWTPLSITINRIAIVGLWLGLFFSLSLFLGSFLRRQR